MADKNGNSAADLGFEDKLWKAADALRSNMDAAEYKHVVFELICLKYISIPLKSNTSQRRGQEGRSVLHAAVQRAVPCRNGDSV